MGKGYQPLDMHNCTTYNKKYREQNNTTEIPMPRTLILSILLLLFLFPLNSSADCVITMTYKDGGKPPLIAAMPDNNGAYIDLFTKAADKIGCSLNLVRHPKKRLHKMLAQGKLDFYPGASFSKKRSAYLYYFANGFETGMIGMTLDNVGEITELQQLKPLNPVWIMEIGGSKKTMAKELGIQVHEMKNISIDTAIKMLTHKRGGFYLADKEPVDYYLKESGSSSYEKLGIKLHRNCCGGLQPMYMGFSRFSPHFAEKPNPDYDPTEKLSPDNFPTMVDENCVAARLGAALLELRDSGESQKIYDNHFSGK